MRVYQGGSGPLAPVTLALKLLDDTGAALANDTVSLDAARFDVSRTAQQTLDLPISRLGPGRYLVTISASASSSTITRELPFRVR